ncbi:MAG: hypothetical protein KDD60_10330, partial [Bdellovibrionales bacterium]|nr:hypothetical protein [Bdellovibrionales bacterium]
VLGLGEFQIRGTTLLISLRIQSLVQWVFALGGYYRMYRIMKATVFTVVQILLVSLLVTGCSPKAYYTWKAQESTSPYYQGLYFKKAIEAGAGETGDDERREYQLARGYGSFLYIEGGAH